MSKVLWGNRENLIGNAMKLEEVKMMKHAFVYINCFQIYLSRLTVTSTRTLKRNSITLNQYLDVIQL